MKEIYHEFISSGAIQTGHFILSSGLHSDKYIQCAKLFMNPKRAERVVASLIEKITENIKPQEIDLIVSPAVGGITLGYEVARQLNKEAIFCERVEGKFTLRRGFTIEPEKNILIVEDVVTTAKSSLEVIELIEKHKGSVIAEASLIDRSQGQAQNKLSCLFIPLLKIDAETYQENNLPSKLANIPVTTPGSRFLKAD